MITKKRCTEEDLKQDFTLFLAYVWQFLSLPPPTPKQIEIAKWIAEGVPEKRQVVQAFRGIGKSWILATYAVWCLWRDPEEKILVISASGGRAKAFTVMCKRLITEIEFLQHLKPGRDRESTHRWSATDLDVAPSRITQSPSLRAVGVTSMFTGSRATLIIVDDGESPENSATVDAREKLLDKIMEVESVILPGGRIVVLGTPQTEETIYTVLRIRGYVTRIWPARVPSPKKLAGYHGCLAPSIEMLVDTAEGKPTDTRFSDSDLKKREGRMGRSMFALQFMLDTSLSDAERYPLKTGDLIVTDQIDRMMGPTFIQWSRKDPDKTLPCVGFAGDRWYTEGYVPPENRSMTKFEGRMMFVDPSGRGADECVAVVVYQLHGKLFLADLFASQQGYSDETLFAMAKMAQDHKVNLVKIEANFGDGMFTKLLQPVFTKIGYNCRFEEIKHSTQKEARIIDTLEPVLNQHRLVVDRGLILRDLKLIESENTRPYSLFYQMTRITRERGALRHDDRLDALAGAVSHWTESMGRDPHDAHRTYLEDQAERSIMEFLEYTDHGFASPTRDRHGKGFGSGYSVGGFLG